MAVWILEDQNTGRSVVLLITVVVRNALNSSRWTDMLWVLAHTFFKSSILVPEETYPLLYGILEGQ